ncbi:MAG: PAS domain-containing protein, partial [Nitrospiraceae bacterium]
MKKSILLNKGLSGRPTLTKLAQDWQPFVDALPHPVFLLDRECTVVLANRAAGTLTVTAGDMKNVKCFQLLHNSVTNIENCPAMNTLETGESCEIEIYEPQLDRHLQIYTAPVVWEGQVIGIIHSFFDITEKKKSEQNSSEIIEIYARSITEMKTREIRAKSGRDAFLNMLEDINDSYRELEDLFLRLILVMVNALDA